MFARAARRLVPAAVVAGGATIASCASSEPPFGLRAQRPPSVVKRDAEWPLRAGVPAEITLEYFALRGLGEIPRLLLEVLEVPYSSVFHFAGNLYKPYAPFGQLPIYREGDLILSQSGTISRHLANKFGIAGDTPAERARVDMYFELAKDISGKKAGMYDPDNHPDGARLKGFLAPAEAACDGTYFVGGKLTLADVAMFNSLQLISECAPDCLARYPKLQTFVANFSARPSVKAYLASERRVPITPNEDGRAPWHKDGYAFKTPLNPKAYAVEYEVPKYEVPK